MMDVNVVLFARARELAGSDSICLSLDDEATVADLKTQLLRQYPALGELLPHCTLAVDHVYSDDGTRLHDGCEIGCIPPVSGG
ncbi:MAG: MoaD/ThiS family protein [Pirellulaceae bacterium]